MGKTYRRSSDDDHNRKKPKHHNHTNGKKLGGMRIINDRYTVVDEDFFDDNVKIEDDIVLNKTRDDNS